MPVTGHPPGKAYPIGPTVQQSPVRTQILANLPRLPEEALPRSGSPHSRVPRHTGTATPQLPVISLIVKDRADA